MGKALFTTGPGIATLATAGVGCVALQGQFGTGKDFFHHKFTTNKHPDKIVDFYSTEEFLQILGIFNFATNFVLAGVVWATDTDQKNTVWNMMEISFDITEREQTLADGTTVVAFFNKRERFKNYIPWTNILMWDQVQNYGYRRRADGVIEVQHQGESFYGPWPVRLLVQLHSYYVIWATERHMNSPLFGSEDLEAVEKQRENIPLHVMSEFIASLKLEQQKAVLLGRMKLEVPRCLRYLAAFATSLPSLPRCLAASLPSLPRCLAASLPFCLAAALYPATATCPAERGLALGVCCLTSPCCLPRCAGRLQNGRAQGDAGRAHRGARQAGGDACQAQRPRVQEAGDAGVIHHARQGAAAAHVHHAAYGRPCRQ